MHKKKNKKTKKSKKKKRQKKNLLYTFTNIPPTVFLRTKLYLFDNGGYGALQIAARSSKISFISYGSFDSIIYIISINILTKEKGQTK
jgi:hypothetical protein